ncbi:pentapeptide repeat-containing protein [Klebsiella michiganensis]|uniref:pentapeptide repeat-containing protein n=1 Tax=Klebsiella michiganensis TaxID=1134687 RepID=UPI0036D2D043
MARNRKNQNAFSYKNHDASSRKFTYKNFNKTHSYHSNFFQSTFTNTSFIGASFKFCNLNGCTFQSSLLKGVLFRGGSLQHVSFNECIINAFNLENCKTDGLRFDKCYIVSSNNLLEHLSPEQINESKIFNSFPGNDEFDPALIDVIQQLRKNDFVRRSSVLHRKFNKIDTITLTYLLDCFDEKFLIEQLPIVCMKIEQDFHTIGYIDRLLRKQV